ncbi:bifunctional aspartokinase/homoserine dehydrogenase, chloroplastic-like isoform X1 [Camellia sinensis]|uniref:bifunctional aspartokinase/homoserine dehydrogenase, chloroplastic-like isoform X1 n=1 Tax=Camellia sinensis TaxID=4442 RepID=UPI00103589B4|nr:bifunctional aspartokinase/homoserine dehydrogenase, chloroplastic-like isoform X1 [Camellia sinensis]
MAFSSSIAPSLRGLSTNASSRDSYATNKIYPSSLSPPQCSPISKMDFICQWSQRKLSTFPICASLADAMQQTSSEKVEFPKGDTWSIHKFGGTCVGSSERIRNVAHIIINDDSERKLVVVSAMSKVTNMMYDLVCKAQSRDDSYIAALDAVLERHKLTALDLLEGDDLASFLLQLHDDINNLKAMLRAIYIGHATESFTDFVVGHGELWSAQMLASLVRKVSGMDCNWMDTREVLIVNPSGSNQVDPDYLESEKRLEKWFLQNPSKTVIATGFIASTPQNIPTTLKRDGSDFSAAIMGALFRARQVTIWTDVDGVYSADPRKVSEAVVLKTLSYQEAWEMSYFGANVLHPRTIIPVMQYDIPIIIRNIFNLSAPGTMICQPSVNEFEDGQRLESYVKGFATIDNLALVNVEGTGMVGVPGTASAIFGAVKDVGANVIMISQASSEHSICFAVPEKEVKAVAEVLQSRFRQALDAERLSQVAVISNCSILAAVGQKMASTPGVSATLFNALAKANINVRAIAQGCSEYNITVVVKQEDCVKALRAVHSRFYFSKTTIAVGIVGSGLIGGTLLDQLRDQAAVLKEQFNIDLRVMGITGSRRMLLSDTGIDLSRWRDLQKVEGEVADLEKFVHNVHGNHFIPNTVLVDCTADSGVVSRYYEWLRRGIHVITPNQKANSGPLEQYLKLRALQRQSYTHYFYEATVGAGLPIISTLQGLLETGDKILRIEGIFSGTLSYIFNNFIGTRAFSEVVAEAKEAGFTEPDPRDDFSGTDVARKVIILARESGLMLELPNIPIENLVPEPLRGSASAEEFLQQLPQYDQDMANKRQDAEEAGEVLRYVGVVDVVNQKGTVELGRYKKDHPFSQLSGSDNIIAFTTERYKKQPLVVRGPGAGAQVTAGGIFSDILRLASYLGAPS